MQVGRLSEQKDPLTFVEGAAQVLQFHPHTQFALMGEGPLEAAVTARIRALGLESQVRLVGWQAEASRWMAAADIVSLTSRWEGMPFVLLEAMACSKPVVATAVNGCPEMIEDGVTGFLTPPSAPHIWAKRVTELLNDPDQAKQMGQRGRQRVEARFTVQHMLGQLDKLYTSCSNGQSLKLRS
jgi:glycosyltransferase involved in cell wall biosynthesis